MRRLRLSQGSLLRQRHACGRQIAAHRHLEAYGTLLLDGGYCEAGESGRWQVRPGMVIVHAAGESHADWFGARTTELIDFALPADFPAGAYWPIDVDRLIASVRGDAEPFSGLLQDLHPVAGEADWPDLLAADIRNQSIVSLGGWAERHGIRRETVSRGFLRAYGVSPATYRLGVRVKSVVAALAQGSGNLAGLAAEHGFFDQAHMSRAVRAATGRTPAQLRQVKSVQDRSAAAA